MPAELAEKAPAGGQQQVDVEEVYTGLRAQDLQEAKDQLVVETADMLHIPLFTAEALLRDNGGPSFVAGFCFPLKKKQTNCLPEPADVAATRIQLRSPIHYCYWFFKEVFHEFQSRFPIRVAFNMFET